jgi:DNA-binding transcriptional regulator YiaG
MLQAIHYAHSTSGVGVINELLRTAKLTTRGAARYLGVSERTVRRYRRTDHAPQPAITALRRARWIAPEAAQYLEYLAVLRGIEHGRCSAPE